MARADKYAEWLVANEGKKGTEEFNTVAEAYKEARQEELAFQQGNQAQSVMPGMQRNISIPGVIKQSAIKGAAGLGDVVVGLPEDIKNLYQYFTTPGAKVPQKSQPITERAKEAGYITPENEPGDKPLMKALDFTTQLAASGGLNPVTTGRALLTQSLPQAAKTIAGQFGRVGVQGGIGSTALQTLQGPMGVENPFITLAGTAIPMGIAGGVMATRGTPSSIANESLQGVTPQQIKMADILLKRSYNLGSPITGAEAIAQVTGGSPLTNVQRIVEQSRGGAPIMSQFMRERPESNRAVINQAISDVGPYVQGSSIPKIMQSTAQDVVSAAEQKLTGKVSPYYQAAGTGFIPDSDLATLTANPKIAEAIKKVTSTADYGVKGADPKSVQTLVAAKQYLSDQFSKQSNAVTGAEKNAARITTIADNQLTDFLKSFSPSYEKGSNLYERSQRMVINPIKESPVGVIAQQEGTPVELMRKQREQLMPTNPEATLQPDDIRRTASLLRRQNPQILPAWTSQSLQGIFDEVAQNLQSGPNQFGGAKFVTAITGNPQQKEVLKTLVTEASGPSTWKGFENMLEVMDAQGKRQAAGSLTAANVEMQSALKEGGLGAAAKIPFRPSLMATAYENWRYGRNTAQLADLLTDPDSVKMIQRLAKTNPNTAKAQAIVDTIAGGAIGGKPVENE